MDDCCTTITAGYQWLCIVIMVMHGYQWYINGYQWLCTVINGYGLVM